MTTASPALPVLARVRESRPVHSGLVTLIRPSRLSSNSAWSCPFTPPLGIAYLAATLRNAGLPVKVLDATAEAPHQYWKDGGFSVNGLTIEEMVERIDPASEIIGVSIMFSQDWPFAHRLIRAIRARFPRAILTAGGEHVTAVPQETLRDCPELNVVALGEGEETLLEVATSPRDHESWSNIPGIAFLKNGVYVRTPSRARIREVDEIPWPAWDLFPMEAYLSSDNMYGVNRGRTMGVLATRGCPYQCTFCSNPLMYGKIWESRDPKDLLDEIEHYINAYGVENVDFYDLTMVLKKDWILEFCEESERRGLKFTWQLPAGTRSEIVDEEIAAALYRTGCRNLTFAPESGSIETLKLIKKKVDLDRLAKAARDAMRQKIRLKLNIIIGFPHETRRHIMSTVLFCWKMAAIGVDAAETMVFSPYPGTELFDQLRRDGKIGELDDAYYDSLRTFLDPLRFSPYCKNVSGFELTLWRVFNMATFFIISFAVRPWRLVRLVKNVFVNRSETVIEHRLGVIFHRRRRAKAVQSAQTKDAVPATV